MSTSRSEQFADWANAVAADPKRRRKVALALIVAGLLTLGIFHQRIYNTLAGPFELDATRLAAMTDVPFQSFVVLTLDGKRVKYSDLIDTGIEERRYKSGHSEHVASYGELFAGGKRIRVRVEQGGSGDDVEGIIATDDRAGGLLVDCRKTSFRSWSLIIAALGALAIVLGLDQLRRARKHQQPAANPLRRFT